MAEESVRDSSAVEVPDSISYADYHDYLYKEVLKKANRPLAEADLINDLKENEQEYLQGAAAHVIGYLKIKSAMSILKEKLGSTNDFVVVESAYALVRIGEVKEGTDALIKSAGLRINANISPSIAAGYLARLNDPRGYITVKGCLRLKEFSLIRAMACQQLFFFVPFEGQKTSDGETIEVFSLFKIALNDKEFSVQWFALRQLEELTPSPLVYNMINKYLKHCTDNRLREKALSILHRK